jgi:thiopeptide-type bacteriocin biosynthesis protein
MSGRARPQPVASPSGFFVLRTPLLPFATVTDWAGGLQAPQADSAALDDAVAADRTQLRRRLEDIVTTPEFRDALYVASPGLAAAVDPWRKEPDSDKGRATERSLVSYLMRAAARPTPFGLFAGCTTGTIGARTQLRLKSLNDYERHTRLDMDYLWALAEAVERDPGLAAGLDYRPNSSLYRAWDRLLFAEAQPGPGGRRYRLVAVEPTPYLLQTLDRARNGARPGALAAALVTGDITRAEADEYIAELAASQVLVADIRPQLTGPPPTEAFVAALGRTEPGVGFARRLSRAAGALAAIDADGIGVPADRYRAAADLLGDLPVPPEPSRFVQVDLMKPAAGVTLGADVVGELQRGVGILHALSRYRRHEGLHQFREQFTQRYQTREVPLAQALDEENGIGFERSSAPAAEAAPLLAGLPLAGLARTGQAPAGLPLAGLGPGQEHSPSWSRRDAFLLGKLTRALTAGRGEITVDAAEAAAVSDGGLPPLPDAFEVLATIMPPAGPSPEPPAGPSPEPAAGPSPEPPARPASFQVALHSASGPSGARILGRFCHADDELHRLVRAHLTAEEAVHPEQVFAEVVHLPEGRVGNILSRPVLRGYEIPYLGRSGAPADRQLPLSDLLVSVQGERIVLRSRRLGREVVPRLTTAHNHVTRGLGVYRFLCALPSQQVSPGIYWDWGPLAQAPFLPRVVSGRVILARARWNLAHDDLAAFRAPHQAALFAAVQRLRQRRRMPRYLALVDGENELTVDLDNILSLEALAHEVRGRAHASLAEMLPGPDQLCASGPEGAFTHQLIVPFVRTPRPAPEPEPMRDPRPEQDSRPAPEPMPRSEPAPAAAKAPAQDGGAPSARRFPPGSEWLYLKLFTGPATADLVLRRIASVLTWALTAGGADQWFFLRYGDPDWHLRLRIHGAPNRLLHETLPLLTRVTAPLLDSGELWRVQLDTYEREVERYGGEAGTRLAERFFHADSDAVLAIVGELTGDAGADRRWRVALRGVDLLFDDLGLTLEQKRDIALRAQRGYGHEFGVDGAFAREVGRRYRRERAAVEALLDPALLDPALPDPGREPPAGLAGSLRALRRRSAALARPASELRAAAQAGQLTADLPELALSLAHMHVNRMLRSAQRAQELVIYELLGRAYSSQAARSQAARPQARGSSQ